MRTKLHQGDEVRYLVNGHKLRGIVQDALPGLVPHAVPVLKRRRTFWMDRAEVRKLPSR